MAKTPFGLLCFGTGPKPPSPAPTAAQGAPQPLQTTVANITRPLLPELHINIWERDTSAWFARSKIEAFLDIGLMLDIQDQSTSLEVLVPWLTKVEDIIDLSGHITKLDAIYAIFNESWTVTNGYGGWIVEDPSGGHEPFAIVAAQPGTAIKHSKYKTSDGDRFGVTVDVQHLIQQAKHAAASTQRKAVEKLYVRFRLRNVDRGAYCVGEKDKTNWWVPSWQRTDVIDFRVNVRRGAPINIENDVGGWFMDFAKIQLFMMRDRNQDIVYEDKLFKACRSLEDEEFWASYSSLGAGVSADAVRSNVKRSMGYQWKDGGRGKRVREFGIAARFKIVEFGIGKYLLAALVIGAMGNSLWDFWKAYAWDPLPAAPTAQAVCVNAEEIVAQARQACAPSGKKDPLVQQKGSQ